MAITGQEIKKEVEMKVDKAYTGYYDPIKMNRLLRMCLTKIIDQKLAIYRTNQKIAEEIQPLTVYGRTVVVNNNKVPINNFIVTSITYAGTLVTVVTENYDNGLANGDSFEFTNTPTGLTGIDLLGTVTITSGSTFQFTNSGAIIGVYTAYSTALSGPKFIGDYYRLMNMRCNFPSSTQNNFIVGPDSINEKGKVFGQATTRFPRAELAENFLHIEPKGTVCSSVEVYYIKKIPRHIDVQDNTYDYSLYFNAKMIDHLTDFAAKTWAGYIKDPDTFKIQDVMINDNA